MANDVEGGKKNRDYNIQKADIHSFQGPTASFAIPQGVFLYNMIVFRGGPTDNLIRCYCTKPEVRTAWTDG